MKINNTNVLSWVLFCTSNMNKKNILNAINTEKDVDGLHPLNHEYLESGEREPSFIPCTPKGCMELLK